MFPVLLLLSCFMYWTAEAALPGQACSATNPCANSICCNGYCSACCDKLHCPKGDYCIVQNPPPSAGLKYQSCFPGFLLPSGSPCWKNEMCQSTSCLGGSQDPKTYNVYPGKCLQELGTTLFLGQSMVFEQHLLSANKCFKFIMQSDSVLAVYRNSDDMAVYGTDSFQKGAIKAMLLSNGNFALLDAAGAIKWSTNTANLGGNRVVLRDDGNVVLLNAAGGIVWQSGKASPC